MTGTTIARSLALTLLVLLLPTTAQAASVSVGAAKLMASDQHPLTVTRAMGIAEGLGYTCGTQRRASGRVVHIRVFSVETIIGDSTTTTEAVFTTTLTVRLHRNGHVTTWDSLFASKSQVR